LIGPPGVGESRGTQRERPVEHRTTGDDAVDSRRAHILDIGRVSDPARGED
jgi:hypothetical protein